MKKIDRRTFVRTTATGAAAISLAPGLTAGKGSFTVAGNRGFDPKGLPTRPLGKLGINVSLLGFGLGNRWMLTPEDEALEMLEYALDRGIFYWDTAASYKNDEQFSEERIGKLLPGVRKKVFLVSKVRERDADGAKASIERSLKRLNTDYIDLMYVHSLQDVEDAESLGGKGKVMEVLEKYRSEGILKHIGCTSHATDEGIKRAVDLYDFEVMMISLNHVHLLDWVRIDPQRFEEKAIPYAYRNGTGVVAMKVIRPRETVQGLTAEKMIRYALTYKEFSNALISMQKKEELEQNLSVIRDFKPLDRKEMKEMSAMMEPFHRGEDLAWMQPGYEDGQMTGPFMASR